MAWAAAGSAWVYRHWRDHRRLALCAPVATLFVALNLLWPQIHGQPLMPALQSPLFAPHVIAYILAYALLGVATLAVFALWRQKTPQPGLEMLLDDLVAIGFGFLLLGLVIGAVWAKLAWGHYWSWDPKETWALVTAAAYSVHLHLRLSGRHRRLALALLPVAYALLAFTWLGVGYLPAAQGSAHVY